MLAYKAKNGPAPPYLMAMVKSRAVPRALRASSTARLEPPSLRTHGRQASRLFSVLAPRWWNELPLGVRTAESLAVFKRRLKTHLFVKHLSTSTDPLFGQCLSSWPATLTSTQRSTYLVIIKTSSCIPLSFSSTLNIRAISARTLHHIQRLDSYVAVQPYISFNLASPGGLALLARSAFSEQQRRRQQQEPRL
ncbi:hypothetical protein NFI96_011790 [Prochilodus magdalenae]|nr:hypothetical protein NFI96_011790 [Prochilodus magdalenae]